MFERIVDPSPKTEWEIRYLRDPLIRHELEHAEIEVAEQTGIVRFPENVATSLMGVLRIPRGFVEFVFARQSNHYLLRSVRKLNGGLQLNSDFCHELQATFPSGFSTVVTWEFAGDQFWCLLLNQTALHRAARKLKEEIAQTYT